jgi:hypothetical protein
MAFENEKVFKNKKHPFYVPENDRFYHPFMGLRILFQPSGALF